MQVLYISSVGYVGHIDSNMLFFREEMKTFGKREKKASRRADSIGLR